MDIYNKLNISIDSQVDEDFYLKSLREDGSGLTFELSGSKSKRVLEFKFNFVYCYMKTNESYRLKTQRKIPDGRYLLLRVEESEFIDWFHAESDGIYKDSQVYHFMFVTGDDFIDVLSNSLPSAKLFKDKSGDGGSREEAVIITGGVLSRPKSAGAE